MVSSFPENRQYANTRPHTINNIVNTTDIDNIIDRVRSAIHSFWTGSRQTRVSCTYLLLLPLFTGKIDTANYAGGNGRSSGTQSGPCSV